MFELRYALRQLIRSPGFTIVALITLTLGMGANTAIFSLLYGVVLRQPPYPGADRLVTIQNTSNGLSANGGRLSRAEFSDYAERQRVFEGLAATSLGRMTLTSRGDREAFAERTKVSRVTPNLFSLLGVAPIRGRAMRAGEELGPPVAVVSHEIWKSRFRSAENILEQTIRLDGIVYGIVGVMPSGFAYPEPDMGAWIPIDLRPRDPSDRTDHYLEVIGRRPVGTSDSVARLDLQRVAKELQHDAPAAYPPDARWSIGMESLRETHFGRMLMPLGLLMAAAVSVLLIACVNVAIMSLLRALARRREISIRLAIGANRRDLVRQLIAEAGLISALGAIGGLLLGWIGLDVVKAFAPADIPRLQETTINVPTALFSGGALVAVTLVVGLMPIVVALRMNAFGSGFQTGRTTDARNSTRLRDLLTIAEIAVAASLLVCAGLTLRSLQARLRVDLGFATEQRFAFKTNLTEREYPDAARVDRFYEQLTSKLESMPGTLSTGAISYLPLSGEGQSVNARPIESADQQNAVLTVDWRIVRGRYFETMGIALVAGRLFSTDDRPGSPPVAVVDDVFARRLWTDETSAIGRTVQFGAGPRAETRAIVGVVHHARHLEPGRESLPTAYAPQTQVYQRGMYTVMRTSSAPQALMPAVRAALASVDASVPMYFAETVAARYDSAIALPRFTAGLVSAFSTLALLLAGVGIFGVTGYAVAQRTREFGIRFALGAQRRHVGGLVLGRIGLLAGVGLAIGTLAGLGLASLMSGLLFGVEPGDPLTIAAVVGSIGLTALVASLAPLRRAVLVNPSETLRAE